MSVIAGCSPKVRPSDVCGANQAKARERRKKAGHADGLAALADEMAAGEVGREGGFHGRNYFWTAPAGEVAMTSTARCTRSRFPVLLGSAASMLVTRSRAP